MPGLGDGGQEAGGGRGGGEWAGRAAAGMDQVAPASLRPDEVDNKYKLFFIPITIFFSLARLVEDLRVAGVGGQVAGKLVRRLVDSVAEGGTLTVLCLAGGEPVPALRLAINGAVGWDSHTATTASF